MVSQSSQAGRQLASQPDPLTRTQNQTNPGDQLAMMHFSGGHAAYCRMQSTIIFIKHRPLTQNPSNTEGESIYKPLERLLIFYLLHSKITQKASIIL